MKTTAGGSSDCTVDALADSIAGQQPAPLSGTVQLQGVMPPPVVNSTADACMDTSATGPEPGQGDVVMDDDKGAQDSEKEVTKEMT
ncbi:MAG: hypothetical protein GY832_39065 [Chloroflexi bacterium]|nr:hypothetical protein [Chloroflexota bacterium]